MRTPYLSYRVVCKAYAKHAIVYFSYMYFQMYIFTFSVCAHLTIIPRLCCARAEGGVALLLDDLRRACCLVHAVRVVLVDPVAIEAALTDIFSSNNLSPGATQGLTLIV
jgi:hypothetical protein